MLRKFSHFLNEAFYDPAAIMRLAAGFRTYIEKIMPSMTLSVFGMPLKYIKNGVGDSYQIPLLNTKDANGISLAVCYEPKRGGATLSSINVYLQGWDTTAKPSYELVIGQETNLVKVAAEVANILRAHQGKAVAEQTHAPMDEYLMEVRRGKDGLALDPRRRQEEKEKAAAQLKAALAAAKLHGVDVNQSVNQEIAPTALSQSVPTDLPASLTADELYESLNIMVRQVVRGEQKSLIVVGAAGVGKTYNIMREVKASGRPYQEVAGDVKSAKALFNILFANRRSNDFVIFDDCDSVFSYANMIKGALGQRSDEASSYVVDYITDGSVENISKWDPEKIEAYYELYDAVVQGDGDLYDSLLAQHAHFFSSNPKKMKALENHHILPPSKFQFLGNVIFITNMKTEQFTQNRDLNAIVSRGTFFSLDLTQKMVFDHMAKLLPTFSNNKTELSPAQKEELYKIVVDTYKEKYPDQFPSFRNFVMLFPWMADEAVAPDARKKYIQRQIAIWNA